MDDLFITEDAEKEIKRIQTALTGYFEMSNLELSELYFRLEFEYYHSGI